MTLRFLLIAFETWCFASFSQKDLPIVEPNLPRYSIDLAIVVDESVTAEQLVHT